LKTAVETITPQQAKKYLQSNTQNRTVRKAWVDRLAGMIRDGQWMLTHQGIAFSDDGRLVDGQHRLLAIIEANKSAQMMVAREVSEEAYRHIDGGASRTLSDRLKLCDDITLNRTIAALIRMRHSIIKGGGVPSVDAAEDEFLEHDKAYMAVGRAWGRKIQSITRSEVGAALVSFAAHAMKKADAFGMQLLSGENLYKGLPAHTLREALIQGRAGSKHPQVETYYKCIYAMRAHEEERTIAILMPAPEDFQGNEYTTLVYRRADQGRRAGETRKKARGAA
jgi:hypothetical protein